MADRLTPLDATFLELEQQDEGATMHIGSVMIFDPLPDGTLPTTAALRAHMTSRLAALPRYRQRLSSERTGGLGWPYWQDDPKFDVANHLRRVALTPPGREADLLEWVGDFFSHRLDRTRPLWEMALIEGLEDGGWAIATKTHHALVDGVGSVGVAQVLLDAAADAVPDALPEHDAEADATPQAPSGNESESHGPVPEVLSDLTTTGLHAAHAGLHAALHPRETFEKSRQLAELIYRDEVIAAPPSSINVPTGAIRRFEVVRAPLAELKDVGRILGGSLNDVLLAACASGLRRLLLSRGDPLPDPGLRAMIPMNVRQDAEALALGNRVSSLFVELPVLEPDPLARLLSITDETSTLKHSGAAEGTAAMLDLAGLAPPLLHASFARSLYATRLFNITITNVPGPPLPLYALGAKMREVQPFVPLAAEHAVGIAIVSYDGSLTIGLCADRDTTPDLRVLRDGIEHGLAELRDLCTTGEPSATAAG